MPWTIPSTAMMQRRRRLDPCDTVAEAAIGRQSRVRSGGPSNDRAGVTSSGGLAERGAAAGDGQQRYRNVV